MVAGQNANGLMGRAVCPIDTFKIHDFWWSGRMWLARMLMALWGQCLHRNIENPRFLVVWEEMAGQSASGSMGPAVGIIETLKIIDF